MMRDLGVSGDGFYTTSRHSSSSRSSSDRLYPSLFPSDDEDATSDADGFRDSDSYSEASGTSDTRATPPLFKQRKPLFPQKDYVDHMRPEEIRWFYKQEVDKEWKPFIGYDSLRIECRYRAIEHIVDEEKEQFVKDYITVRGGLYQVEVESKKCSPIYWSGDVSKITRGMWFKETSWQPIEDEFGLQIETDHLEKFLGHRMEESSPAKGKKPVIHRLRFQNFYIEWLSPSEAYLYSDSTSSKIANKLGISKADKLCRGYRYEAVMDDKPPDISHLVFVIHGIGQKMETGSIIKSCRDLRNQVNSLKQKYFPNLADSNQRAEFLPVEWRTRLKLDGDTVDSITPQKLRGIRTILNSSAMDILYYTSPLYRSEITQSLQTELNRLHDMFCTRNPYFVANGGKISIVAHSLGAVISYDIITGWNPIQLYDQFVTSVIEDEKEQAAGSSELQEELADARRRVNELENLLLTVHEKQKHSTTVNFKLENLFCLGSPLAVFLSLRGIRPKGKGTLDHIIPASSCKRLFNIYHPYDPVAYRLEPLILKHYSTIVPLPIQKHDMAKKVPYNQMKATAYAAFQGSSEKLGDKGDPSDSVDTAEYGSSGSRDASPARSQGQGRSSSLFGGLFKKANDNQMSAELKRLEKDAEAIENSLQDSKEMTEEFDQTELEYRIDYQLREGSFVSGYISLLTSHTSYWKNSDVAYFLLCHLHPQLEDM